MEYLLVAICIYDAECCNDLKEWIEEYSFCKGMKAQVEIFRSMEDFRICIETKRLFDIIFVEVEFPNKFNLDSDSYYDCGIDLGRGVRSYAEYNEVLLEYFTDEVEGDNELFDLQPINFRFRPITQEQIFDDLDKAYKILNTRSNYISYKKEEQIFRIALADICYVVAVEKCIKIHCSNSQEVKIYKSLDQFMVKYGEFGFLRCHRSFVVNTAFVVAYKGRKIYLADNTLIQVGNKYAANVKWILSHRYSLNIIAL